MSSASMRCGALVAALMLAGACTRENSVSVEPTGPDASSTTSVQTISTADAPTTVAVAPTTAQAPTGSSEANDCAPPQQFRDTDGDGFGECFRADGSTQPPTGDTIVQVPGSANIVRSGANATVEVSDCGGNGAAGTIVIVGQLTNLGDTIDSGSVNVQLLDTTGALATVVARLGSVGSGVGAPLDFETPADDSPARTLGDIAACWFDSVTDVTLFTTQ